MIDSSSAYKLAVYGDTRRVVLRAVIDISSPDIVFGVVNSDGEDEFSVPGQVHDHVFEIVPSSPVANAAPIVADAFGSSDAVPTFTIFGDAL